MNRVTMGLGVVAVLLPLVAAPTAGAATVLHLSPLEGMEDNLQGSLCQQHECRRIESENSSSPIGFPNTYPEGVVAIETAIDETSGEKIVFAYSSGARMTAMWMEEHADDADAPPTEELSFVLIGNPTRAHGGSDVVGGSGPAMPQTQYQVVDVSIQYDLTSDSPNNPASPYYLLALANAYSGFSRHLNYVDVNIDDPANAKWTEGNTTYILVPTENLPLLDPLRMWGMTALADDLNGPLKALVEQGYNRPVPFPTPTQPAPPAITTAAASAPSASVVADPRVAPPDATVPLRMAPAPAAAADSAPTANGPDSTAKEVVATVQQNVAPHGPELNNASEAPAPSTNVMRDGNKFGPVQIGGNGAPSLGGLPGAVRPVAGLISSRISKLTDGLQGADAETGNVSTDSTSK